MAQTNGNSTREGIDEIKTPKSFDQDQIRQSLMNIESKSIRYISEEHSS